jgi:hypothetical protein
MMKNLNESSIHLDEETRSNRERKNKSLNGAKIALFSPTNLVSAGDQFPFFDNQINANPYKKGGIRNLNIEELELRAMLKMMEHKFN